MRTMRWTAWSLWVLAWSFEAVGLVLWGHNRSPLSIASVLPAVTFPLLGTLIISRHPRNLIGWIFCAIGLFDGLLLFTTQYATYALVTEPRALWGAAAAAWTSSWIWAPPIWGVGTLCYLLFPDGRPPSHRWRPVVWLAAGGLALYVGALSLAPWPANGTGGHSIDQALKAQGTGQRTPSAVRPLFSLAVALTPSESQRGASYPIDNPLGIHGSGPILATIASIGAVLILMSFIASLGALVFRFRHAGGRERQQLKWVAYTAVLMAVIHTVVSSWFPELTDASLGVILSLFAAAIAVAILRHHLYDIDLVINRTLVYGLLTALLGAVYASVVLLLGQLFGGLGAEPPRWVVAGATLSAAALFQPARRRIQAAVDRHFSRRKYDAAKTVETFTARLREQIDLDSLSAELLAVVDQTMQPTHASLWLRPSTERVGRTGA
jgi:hypothetical protein